MTRNVAGCSGVLALEGSSKGVCLPESFQILRAMGAGLLWWASAIVVVSVSASSTLSPPAPPCPNDSSFKCPSMSQMMKVQTIVPGQPGGDCIFVC